MTRQNNIWWMAGVVGSYIAFVSYTGDVWYVELLILVAAGIAASLVNAAIDVATAKRSHVRH